MMKKLLLSLLALAFVGTANAQLLSDAKVQSFRKPVAQSSLLSNILGDKKVDNKKRVVFGSPAALNLSGAKSLDKNSLNANLQPMSINLAKVQKSPATRAAESTHTWWGYLTSDSKVYAFGFDALSSAFEVDYLSGQTKYNLALIVPGTYKGAKVDSVAVALLGGLKYDDLKVWVSPVEYEQVEQDGQVYNVIKMPETAEDAESYVTVPQSEVSSIEKGYYGYVEVKLPKTVTVPADGCIVGYSFTGSSSETPVLFLDSYNDNSCLLQYEYTDGTRYFDDFSQYIGSLTTIVGMDLSDCEANDVSVEAAAETTVLVGDSAYYNFYLTNNSAKPVTEIEYTLLVDGEGTPNQTYTLENPIYPGVTATIPAKAVFDYDGIHTVELTVSKVNGNKNVTEQNSEDNYSSATNSVIALEKGANRVSVVEEQTGTWCGWCPRGHVALANLNRDLGDKVITLAGHFTSGSSVDPMNCYTQATTATELYSNYGAFTLALQQMLGGSGFPGAIFDRMAYSDPYVGATTELNSKGTVDYGATKMVQLIDQYYPSEADFSMTATWTDDTKSALNVETTTTFGYDRYGEVPYGIVYVLSENGMKGTGSSWRQSNYYCSLADIDGAEQYDNDDMASWFSSSQNVKTTYDNVVVQSWNPSGLTNTLVENPNETDIVKGQAVKNQTVLSLNSSLIQDKEQLTLSALLINLNSLSVTNAAKVFVGSNAAGIEDVNKEANNTVVSRFNLNGMSINAPQKGINLVKTADGKVIKVAVGK